MQSEDETFALIDQIYDAALAPEKWGGVLEGIGRRIGASSGTSLWFNKSGLELVRADIWNVSDEALRDYQIRYLAFCPRYRVSRELKAGVVYNDETQRQSDAALNREYYDFVDKYEIGKATVALVEKSEELTIGVNFYCSAKRDFDEKSKVLLSILMPHLRRATNVTSKYLDVIDKADFGEAIFNAQPATLTLDRSGRIVRVNPAAEILLGKKDGIFISNGFLMASSVKDNVLLQEQIGLAVQTVDLRRSMKVHSLLISRQSGCAPFYVEVSVLKREVRMAQEVALVTVTDAPKKLRLVHLKRTYGLTDAEVEVIAMLQEGKRPEQVADARKTSIQTVRSQIKSVYTKTGVGSQIELLSKITGG